MAPLSPDKNCGLDIAEQVPRFRGVLAEGEITPAEDDYGGRWKVGHLAWTLRSRTERKDRSIPIATQSNICHFIYPAIFILS